MPASVIANIDGFGLTTQPLGPYSASGKFWVVLTDNVAFAVRIYASSDNGTTWTEQDAANRPSTIAINNNFVASVISGTTISVAYVAVGGALNEISFNCATGLWGTKVTGGPTVSTLIPSVLMQRRSDNSLVIVYGIDVNGVSNVNTAYVVFSGGAFGSGTNISPSITTDDVPFGIVLGALDRVHIFTGSPIATGNVNHTAIQSNNTVGPRRTIASHYKNPEFDAPYMQPIYDGTNLVLPLVSDPASVAFALTAPESLDPITWTQNNLSDVVAFFFFGSFLMGAATNSGLDYTYFTTLGGVRLSEYTNSSGSWGAATTIYTSAGHVGSISAGIVGGGRAVVFSEKPTTGGTKATRTMFLQITSISICNTRYGVNTFLTPQPANKIPYRLCVNNNRLYCVLPDFNGIFSCFVYYLGRENNQGGYWYRYVIDPAALFSEEDGTLYGGFGDAGVGNLFTLDTANTLTFAGSTINVDVVFPFSKEEINQRKDVYHLRFHIDTGGSALNLTGYTEFSTIVNLGQINANGLQELNLLIQNTTLNLSRRIALRICGAANYFKLIDWSIDYDARPEPISFLRIATNYQLAAKKRLRTIPVVIDTRGSATTIDVIADGVDLGAQSFTTSERTTVFYYMSTDVFATDIIINITAANGKVFEFYDTPSPVNVEVLPVGKLFDQIGPVEFERNGELFEFRVRMLATTNTITYNVWMDDVQVLTAQPLTVTPNVDKTYGPIKVPKGIRGSVCRIEFLSSSGVFYRWNCKIKYYSGGVKSDTRQVNIQDKSVGLQS